MMTLWFCVGLILSVTIRLIYVADLKLGYERKIKEGRYAALPPSYCDVTPGLLLLMFVGTLGGPIMLVIVLIGVLKVSIEHVPWDKTIFNLCDLVTHISENYKKSSAPKKEPNYHGNTMT